MNLDQCQAVIVSVPAHAARRPHAAPTRDGIGALGDGAWRARSETDIVVRLLRHELDRFDNSRLLLFRRRLQRYCAAHAVVLSIPHGGEDGERMEKKKCILASI